MEPRKEMLFNIKVRVYGQKLNTTSSHSFCVDDTRSGISAPIGQLSVDVRTTNIEMIRELIKYDRSFHMDKHSMIFREAVFIMDRLPNYYNRPQDELKKYYMGFMKKETKQVKLIHPSREKETMSSLISAVDFFLHDLIMVPLSQIPYDLEEDLKKEEQHFEIQSNVMPHDRLGISESLSNENDLSSKQLSNIGGYMSPVKEHLSFTDKEDGDSENSRKNSRARNLLIEAQINDVKINVK